MVEQLLGAAHVRVVALALLAAEMADLAEVHEGGGHLGADHVLELLLADVDDVDLDAPRGPIPSDAIDAAYLVVLAQPLREQSALAACDPGDQDLFH